LREKYRYLAKKISRKGAKAQRKSLAMPNTASDATGGIHHPHN